MNCEVAETVAKLTSTIKDAAHKPLLRPVLEAELLKMRYEPEDVKEVLDRFYQVTVQ